MECVKYIDQCFPGEISSPSPHAPSSPFRTRAKAATTTSGPLNSDLGISHTTSWTPRCPDLYGKSRSLGRPRQLVGMSDAEEPTRSEVASIGRSGSVRYTT